MLGMLLKLTVARQGDLFKSSGFERKATAYSERSFVTP
jgi:hypothetical protein